jgi:hypothetical protein
MATLAMMALQMTKEAKNAYREGTTMFFMMAVRDQHHKSRSGGKTEKMSEGGVLRPVDGRECED